MRTRTAIASAAAAAALACAAWAASLPPAPHIAALRVTETHVEVDVEMYAGDEPPRVVCASEPGAAYWMAPWQDAWVREGTATLWTVQMIRPEGDRMFFRATRGSGEKTKR